MLECLKYTATWSILYPLSSCTGFNRQLSSLSLHSYWLQSQCKPNMADDEFDDDVDWSTVDLPTISASMRVAHPRGSVQPASSTGVVGQHQQQQHYNRPEQAAGYQDGGGVATAMNDSWNSSSAMNEQGVGSLHSISPGNSEEALRQQVKSRTKKAECLCTHLDIR